MSKSHIPVRILVLAAFILTLLPVPVWAAPPPTPDFQGSATRLPLVAIHVSENTQALEAQGAWYTSWHYFVMHESLKEALRSDGTPFVEVSDAQIAGGELLGADGSPKYPILISLASEAAHDNEVEPLRRYVAAGGFLFVGSSAFTRTPDGATRGDFALADEMGMHVVNPDHNQNWYQNASFSKQMDHRLVWHIPSGALSWRMPLHSEEIPWGVTGSHTTHANHYVWRVTAPQAEVIANGSSGPLLATRSYGKGRFIYHGAFNPLIGHGGNDPGMYAYLIYRNAIEWAFETANLPIVKLSPWRYAHDAAMLVRHDFENTPSRIQSIEASAQAEHSVGAKGDYYFCTGTLREHMGDPSTTVASLRRAVSQYGATIGSHNGGLVNPVNPGLAPSAYDYWHWGPDEALDTSPPGYADGEAYARASIATSFEDIEGWLAGVDNGRAGCGAADNCPRTWVSPYFNSAREGSYDILAELGSAIMGEQKLSPFPHWTMSYESTARHPHVTLPPSDWYIGASIAQSLESGHTATTVRALVDFYYDLGALINLYGHSSSTGGAQWEYVSYAAAKPRVWKTNAVGVYDWWVLRSNVTLTPGYSKTGSTAIAGATISGAGDPDTAIEMVIPHWNSGAIGDLEVALDGVPADPADYRTTGYGVKIKVGAGVSNVEVRYTPLQGWIQTDWDGGAGQAIWADETRYESASGIDESRDGQLRLSIASGGDALLHDDFVRPPAPGPEPFTWITPAGSTPWPNRGTFNTQGGSLNAGTTEKGPYGYAYTDAVVMGDHSVEADIRFPSIYSFSGGGGIFGRLNPSTGQRYAVWLYPEASAGGNATIRAIKFYDQWGWWNSPGFASYTVPGGFGAGWHHVKLALSGNTIQVFYDSTPVISDTDNGTEPRCGTYNSCAPYTSGYAGVDLWTATTSGSMQGPSYNNFVVRDNSGAVVFSEDFGQDPVDPLLPWTARMGDWTLTDETVQAASRSGYAYLYTAGDPAWTDYTVEARIQFAAGAFGGGIGGRLNPATGAHYAAWVYPDGSSGGSNVLKLVKFRDWSNWNGQPMGGQVSLPSVGTGWHTLKLDFQANRIRVFYDGSQLLDVTDNNYDGRPAYLSGGVSVDAWSNGGGAFAIKADDVAVRSPALYGSSGRLLSSAFDGGVGVQWQNIAWNAAAGGGAGLRLRTRTADRADQLAAAPWSDWYTASGSPVTSPDKRWIQYELELTSDDPTTTPIFYENAIGYVPGIQLPGSNLTYTGPAAGDSHTQAVLSAALLDDNDAPILDRAVGFTLDGVNGTLSATGTTGGGGQVTAPMDLLTAPGPYTLTIAFAGDAQFAPISAQVPFEVTSPWSEWVQDSQADFSGNSLADTDAGTQPGSLLLDQTQAWGGEEAGAFSVDGVPGWGYRRRLFIDNNVASPLPAGYSVALTLDTAALTGQAKLRGDGNDLRVVWSDGASLVELDRVAETPFNSNSTTVWFKTQMPIPASARDSSYFIYYGNPSAGAPPADPSRVYALWDAFDGAALDLARWSPQGTVTVGGGQAHLAANANIIGTLPYTYALLEMRVQATGENNYMWWGWEDGRTDAPNFIVFEEFPLPSGFEALLRSDSQPFSRLPIADPAGGLTAWHTYAADWSPGGARWLIDGAQVMSAAAGVPDSSMYANFYARSVPLNLDWVRARLRAAAEPAVSPSTPQVGYAAQGEMLSIAYDTGRFSAWKYLTWDAATPSGTGVRLQARTSATQAGLTGAGWTDYDRTGLLIGDGAGRWVQYRAVLTTADPFVTPELHRVTIYYTGHPVGLTLSPAFATVAAGDPISYTARVDDGDQAWDVTGETAFSIQAGAGGAWAGGTYTGQAAGHWTVTGQYLDLSDTASLTVEHSAAVTLTLAPAEHALMAGELVTYTAAADDAYANGWDATAECAFSVEGGAGGTWLDNAYTSQAAGDWEVTARHTDGVTGTATLHVLPVAGLSVAMADTPDPVVVGNTLIYTITVTNYGPSDAVGVALRDDPPAQVALGQVSSSQGSCDLARPITCELDTLTEGATATVTLVVTPSVAGIITNTASITSTDWDPNPDDNTALETTEVHNPERTIYLPFIVKGSALGPDLVVEKVTVNRDGAQVVIKNQGQVPVTDSFWVDLYVNPVPPPTGVNQIWNDGRSAQGIAWGVEGSAALPLNPGETLILTTQPGDPYYHADDSAITWPLPAGTPIYVQVDSVNMHTDYGGVYENHEMSGGSYNNIAGPFLSTLDAAEDEGVHLPPSSSRQALAGPSEPLPGRR
jgi:uncharacterized repeat protein (TIGR01451 family)